MDFVPRVSPQLKIMDAAIFSPASMGLREQLLEVPLEQRLTFDAEQNLFFVNFEGLNVNSDAQVERIRSLVTEMLSPLKHKVLAIVNYDNFSINPEVVDRYVVMVCGLVERFYSDVTRYTTSSFMRAKLGAALERREVAPHIYETADEALAGLEEEGKE
jgi:propionate CoA-transferase